MSTNGHLKFQGTNRATFVGATSNIMFDTTTTSLGIGVTGTDHPSSNLYITGNAYISNSISVGGVLTMGTVNVVARHDLEAVTAMGNTTPVTVEFQNADTSLVTTGNVEVGKELTVTGNTTVSSNLTVSGNTETKNINMLHTANTASIKLNSNVVAEFPRSKKLIKYPRVAIASGQSGLGNGYTQDGYIIQVSSEWGGIHLASNAFNSIQAYQYEDCAWISSGNPDRYTPSTGIATTEDIFQDVNGSWIGLTLPEKIKLSSVHLYNRRESNNSVRPARKGIVWGSDGGSTWYRLKDFNNGSSNGALNIIMVESDVLYNQFRVQITEIHNDPEKDAVAIGELEFYGAPEYDSDAHGADIVIKSKANVPNTDWLEVYYDANGLPTGAVSSPVSGLGGTTISATTLGDPQVSNDAFVFDGSGDAIVSGATSFSGSPILSYSVWFKTKSISSGYNSIVAIGYTSSTKSIGFRIDSGYYRFYVYGNAAGESITTNIKPEIEKWTHVTVIYDGLNSKLYIDGNFAAENANTTSILALDPGAKVALGNYIDSNGNISAPGGINASYDGSIANFRLFNRALLRDEIYQLYAYQKSFFGHGDLSMTLKAGRLGIGTSEPRATLDVRGDVLINGYQLTSMFPGFASGGDDVYDFDGYRVHAFTSSGTFHIPSGDLQVDILLVGGGGGGGQDNAGGGGAGGLVIRPGLRLQSTRYAITIGSGGIGCPHQNSGPAATAGEDTKIETYPIATGPQQTVSDANFSSSFGEAILVAKGGGNGISGGTAQGVTPPNGGSGGGGASEGAYYSTGGTQIQQYQTSGPGGESAAYGFGNNGGNGVSDGGGGGGGAGAVGQNGSVTFSGSGGNGGDGKCSAVFSELEANFADMFGTRYGEIIDEEAWFAGGGGGGNRNNTTTGFSTGGKGGGGSAGSTNATNGDGLPNTGGGGAGATWFDPGVGYNLWGGNGGSGIVLLRYKL